MTHYMNYCSEHAVRISNLEHVKEVQCSYIVQLQQEREKCFKKIAELQEKNSFLVQQVIEQQGIILQNYASKIAENRHCTPKIVRE